MCMWYPARNEGARQLGVPLNDETFASMQQVEVDFWREFMKIGELEIKRAETAGQIIPYEPSPAFVAMYRRGIKDYQGGQYCQVQQLSDLFNFGQTS